MSRELMNVMLGLGVFLGLLIMNFAYWHYVSVERREVYRKMSWFDPRRYAPIWKRRGEYAGPGYTIHILGGALCGLCIVGEFVLDAFMRTH